MPQSPNSTAMPREDLQTVMDFDLEMQQANYVGSRIMPLFTTRSRSARFSRVKLGSLLAAGNEKIERAAKSGFSRADWEFDQDTFITVPRGVEEEIDDDEREIYGTLLDAELMATMRAYERLFSAYESRVIAQTVTASISASQTDTAVAAWDDPTNADPREDVKLGKYAMWERTGMMPNTLVISEWAFEDCRDVQSIIDRLAGAGAGQSTRPDEINEQQLAQILGVDQVLVAKAISYSTSAGVGSVFPRDKALLIKTPRTNSLVEPCYGRTFVYEGVWGNFLAMPFSYRDEKIACDIVRLAHESQEKVMYSELAQVITGLVTEESEE